MFTASKPPKTQLLPLLCFSEKWRESWMEETGQRTGKREKEEVVERLNERGDMDMQDNERESIRKLKGKINKGKR